jgi:carboxylesterase type B
VDARWFGNFCLQQPAQVGFGSDGGHSAVLYGANTHFLFVSLIDCLTLNVWKPAGAKRGDKLPVAVYIHGGGNYYAVGSSFYLYVFN